MPLKLSQGEKLIRCWNYAGDNTSSGKNDDVLIVTDKRLVATSTSPDSVRRTEILLSSIKSISSSYTSKRTVQSDPKGGFVAIGIIFLLAGIILLALSSFQGTMFLVFGVIASIIGIVFIIIGAKRKTTVLTSADFSLVITTHGQEGTPFTIGKVAGDTKSQTVVINSITINEKVIMDIIDTIGAVALNKISPADTDPTQKSSHLIDGATIVQPQKENELETTNNQD